MANTPTRKRTAAKSVRKTTKPTLRKRVSKKAEGLKEKARSPRLSEERREQLRKWGDRFSEATDKGILVAKEMAGKVRHFAVEATELTKLKIEIHKLKNVWDRLFVETGEKLWDLYRTQDLSDVEDKFSDDFKTLQTLEADIAEKERELKKISLK